MIFSYVYFLLAAIASIILFVYLIVVFHNKKDYKATHWSIFHSLNIISIIAAIISFPLYSKVIVDKREDELGLFLLVMGMAAITVVFFVILEIAGIIVHLIQKRRAIGLELAKKPNRKVVCLSIIIILSTFIGTVISSAVFLSNRDAGIEKIVKSNSIEYLNEKYGEQDFVYEGYEIDYITGSFISKSFTGFLAKFKSNKYNTEFNVVTDEQGNVEEDSFISNYFGEELDCYSNKEEFEALQNRVNDAVNFIEDEINKEKKIVEFSEVGAYELDGNDVITDGLSKTYGKVPTKEEMFDVLQNYYMANSLKFHFLEDNLNREEIEIYCDRIHDILKKNLVNDEFVSRFYYKVSVENNEWDIGFIADIGNKKYFEMDPKFSPYSVSSIKKELIGRDY